MKEWSDIFNECYGLLQTKNADYASDDDAFRNFRLCESTGITTVERGILVRMSDKFQRIVNLIDGEPAVKDEKIDDTIKDLINYSVILLSWLRLNQTAQEYQEPDENDKLIDMLRKDAP